MVQNQARLVFISNNHNTTFKTEENRKEILSELLLHYNYGTVAMKLWDWPRRAKPPYLPAPITVLIVLLKKIHNRTTVPQKLKVAWATITGIRSQLHQSVESEDQEGI